MKTDDIWFLVKVTDLREHPWEIILEAVKYEHPQYGFPFIYAERAKIAMNGKKLTHRQAFRYFEKRRVKHFFVHINGTLGAAGDPPRVIRLPNGRMVFAPWDYYIEATYLSIEEGDEDDILGFITPQQPSKRPRAPQRPSQN